MNKKASVFCYEIMEVVIRTVNNKHDHAYICEIHTKEYNFENHIILT